MQKAMVGVNIGGWMVLEPWITPSLFYRFLGKTHSEGVGIDSWSFCGALGPELGNKVMRAHWDHWLTEDHIRGLAERDVEIVRMPIGDWTFKPYGHYVGCMDGAAEKITWALDTFAKYNIKVMLDMHAVKGSWNGYDNSGYANRTTWVSETHFRHWDQAYGEWMGTWDPAKNDYVSIKQENILWAVDAIDKFLQAWRDHPALYAIEAANEPWDKRLDVLKDYYRTVREHMKKVAPHLKFVFYAAGEFSGANWNDLFPDDDCENVIMDKHNYNAWWET